MKMFMLYNRDTASPESIQAKEGSDVMKRPLRVFTSLCHQEMDMGVEINFLSKCLDDGHHAWSKLGAGCSLEIF